MSYQQRSNAPRPGPGQGPGRANFEVLFDPDKPERELLDSLAEKQADMLQVNSSQLRRFFGEIKELYRQFNALAAVRGNADRGSVYAEHIEPRFKMLRSKVSYATRVGGQSKLCRDFADFLQQGIERVHDHQQFVKFVLHVEAVVGFMYGKDKVKK